MGQAQTSAQILGIVRDTAGLPIAGAAVDAAGEKSGEKRKLITDKDGAFRLAELPPDTYRISATCDTCNDASNIVEVGAGQARSIQLELDTTSASSIVSLDTHGTTLDAMSAKLGMNVIASEIAELPVNGRTFAPLALTAPLVSNAGGGTFADLRFAGQSTEQNRYTLDNVDDSSVIDRRPGFVPLAGYEFRLRNSLDTVDEFRVDSAGYSVEDGMGAGGQIKLVSKAATSGWHGSIFEYLRDDDLQARNYFDVGHQSELQMHQFGGSGGGSLLKDRLFVFGSFEKLLQQASITMFETTPSAGARHFAAAAILPALNAMPFGFAPTSDPDVDLAQRDADSAQRESNLSARVDYIPAAGHRLFFRYSHADGRLEAPDYSTTLRTIRANSKPDQMVVSWMYAVAPDVINQFTSGINRAPTGVSVTSGSAMLDGSRILVGDQSIGAFASPGNQIVLAGGNYGSSAEYRGRSYNLRDAIDVSKGVHSLQAGVEWQAVRAPLKTGGGLTYAFRDDTSFLADTDADVTFVESLPWRKAERENYAGYIQDQWRANSDVQIVFGLRYEYFSPTREAKNAAALFDYRNFKFIPASGAFYDDSKLGFEPRFSITWSPKSLRNDTVFRFGSGIYDGPNAFLNTISPIENSVSKLFLSGAAFPVTATEIQSSTKAIPSPRGLDLGTFGRSQRNVVFTASIQQALAHRFVGEAAYSGILSRHLTEESLANLATGVNPASGNTIQPNSAFAAVPYLMNGGNSSYHALELRLNRHLVDNLTLTAAYNLSHSIGNTQGTGDEQLAQNPDCLACERSDNNFDIRQAFSFASVYAFPFGQGRPHLNTGALGKLLGNWTAAGVWNQRSGLPINVLIDRSNEIYYSPGTQRYYSPSEQRPSDAVAVSNTPGGLEGYGTLRPNLVAGVNAYERNGLQWLNPAAFATPAAGSLGSLGRNALRGPGFGQLDLQLGRTFALSDRVRLQLKAEAFNLFNHPNFSNPTLLLPDITADVQPGGRYNQALAPGFGVLNSTIGRTVGLGTSRQLQLSFRLEF